MTATELDDIAIIKAVSALIDLNPDASATTKAETAIRAYLAAIGAEPEDDTESQWRDLALQFDGHRIQAMCLLRGIAADKAGKAEIEAFLSAPPLSGEQVLADRIAEMRQTAKELRENANGDCNAARQAIYWDGKADALKVAIGAGGQAVASVDDVAARLWKADAENSGTPASVAAGRTREAFDEQAESLKERWRKFANVAIAHPAPSGQAVADLTYGKKLIAEAITHHFGERDERYDEYEGDTTVQDVWEAFDALSAIAHPVQPGWRDSLLDKLAEHRNFELSWGAHPDDDTEACWQVHRVNGGRNDREWTLIGVGNTPHEALYAALPAAPQPKGE